MNKSLSTYLKETRLKSGLTQLELSEKLGYKSGQLVSNFERGASGIPENSIKNFCKATKSSAVPLIEAIITDYRERLKKIAMVKR